ncbi:MAG: asparagine synthase (glutamine-hydrolyzing) [Acidimicrobiia bacterium]
MCGIAGSYRWPGGAAVVQLMSEHLAHRGPDAAGLHRSEGTSDTCLAHRRLSIIDLSAAANQPFSKGGLTLVYNGELYNYRQLKRELASCGVSFTTASDTEVVLEAWRRWGHRALDRFRGMFAFALLDDATGHMVLARDQLGIKPLYFLERSGGMVFASELKALVAALGPDLSVDPGALVASLLYYWVPDQRCAIRDVRKLPPGSWAEFRPDRESRVRRYWNVTDVAAEAAQGPAVDLRPVIEESVAAHLVSDVPVSSFLSGGLDSSIVTVLARRRESSVDAYTITFRSDDQRREAMPDDAVYARRVAAQYDIDLHEIEIAPDIVELLPTMVDILDEPIGDPAAINTLLICSAARDAGVKVLLSGMGADELFGGYRKHLACVTASQYRRLPAPVRNRVVRPVVGHLPVAVGGKGLRGPRWAKRFLTFADLPEEAAFRRSYTLYDTQELMSLVGPDLLPYVGDVVAEHQAIYDDTTLPDHVNRMCLADTRMFLPGLNLAYTDRASMAASTEVRVPFVDVEVVRSAFSIPGADKVRNRRGKVALKEAASAWLPDDIIHRPKASFGAPIRAWISRDLREMVDDLVVSGDLVGAGYVERSGVQRLIQEERTGREDRAKQIWHLLTLELWYRHNRALGVRG